MKYVMIDGYLPIVFTEAMQHVSFKKMGNITSAGFCDVVHPHDGIRGWVQVYGVSVSLGMMIPGPQDAIILTQMLIKNKS